MTPVGHSLTGAAIAVLGVPPGAGRRRLAAAICAAVFAANIPDLPLPGWGHSRYNVSHSVLLAAASIAALGLAAAAPGIRRRLGGGAMVAVFSLAWLSHFALDTLYKHGRGLAMFWPVSDARVALPVPWFSTLDGIPPSVSWQTATILAIEGVCYGALLAAAVAWRRRLERTAR